MPGDLIFIIGGTLPFLWILLALLGMILLVGAASVLLAHREDLNSVMRGAGPALNNGVAPVHSGS